MAQSSRPCEGCGATIRRTSPTAPIKSYCGPDCRPRCAVDECDRVAKARGYCNSHYHRLERYGDPLTPLAFVRGEGGYDAVHYRVKTARGKACDLLCVDCGGPAEHWSYNHDDPDELVDPNTRKSTFSNARKYSRKIEHYSPRCASCHRKFDRGRNQV